MKIEIIETLLVIGIVCIQLWVFAQTFIQIGVFKRIIPELSSFKILKLKIPVTHLERRSPKEILADIEYYKNSHAKAQTVLVTSGSWIDDDNLVALKDETEIVIEKAEVSIIESEINDNKILTNILFSINNYLIRNRGASSDFNLIKDIVERNTDTVEEDINISIAVPLYLGLMGTMIGIVIGLFNMPDLSLAVDTKAKDILLNNGISLLIGGVKIAMIASFVGLLLTIINSGWIFKGSRNLIEARKNDFYTFIQIELLPIINQGLANTLDSLQRNLLKFNNEFTSNLRQVSGIFNSNTVAIKAQKELLDAIDKTKVAEMTKYNVKVLQQLDVSVTQFEKFNKHLTNVNAFVENSENIVSSTNELLKRTDNFRVIADSIENQVVQNSLLLEFLSTHFNKLEEHKEFTSNAVADVGHAISSTFKDLQEHIQNSSEAVKQFTIEELDALKKALSESKTNLSNLEHLASLNNDVSQMKNSSASQGERIKQQLDDLNKTMSSSIAILEKIEHSSFANKAIGLTTSIKHLFKSKK
jgi:hypothetical protein